MVGFGEEGEDGGGGQGVGDEEVAVGCVGGEVLGCELWGCG